jgi:hypothetical protein
MTDDNGRAETEKLGEDIVDLINKAKLSDGRTIVAVLGALLSVLTNIRCRHCRKLIADGLADEMFPSLLGRAMDAPAEGDHVH